jgi:hypothetical protein
MVMRYKVISTPYGVMYSIPPPRNKHPVHIATIMQNTGDTYRLSLTIEPTILRAFEPADAKSNKTVVSAKPCTLSESRTGIF